MLTVSESWAGKEWVRRTEEVAYYYTRVKKNVTTAASSSEHSDYRVGNNT